MRDLLALARRIVDALPADVVEDAAVTGSVSRGVADELSDIEMLLVTPRQLELDECYSLARDVGLSELDSWGPQGGPTRKVFGYLDGVPVELIWWFRQAAEEAVAALLRGEVTGSADALAHAVPLRGDAIARWREQLATMPPEVAAAVIEDAALTWGGFAPEGYLTIARPGDTLVRLEYMTGDAGRVVRIVYALNGKWPPTTKRLAARVDELAVTPDRLAARIEEALTEPDPRRALRLLAELQLETAELAPDGPNVIRARRWLPRVIDALR